MGYMLEYWNYYFSICYAIKELKNQESADQPAGMGMLVLIRFPMAKLGYKSVFI